MVSYLRDYRINELIHSFILRLSPTYVGATLSGSTILRSSWSRHRRRSQERSSVGFGHIWFEDDIGFGVSVTA